MAAREVTSIGDGQRPIILTASFSAIVSGSVLPADAFIRAMQTVSSGSTVEVAATTAFPAGSYSLALPGGAPFRGEYGSGTLPISLTPDPANAGKYDLEISAAGYVPKAISGVNVSGGDVAVPAVTLVRVP